ncbi:ABC transporter substrate-binding protein [bacterium]|nr:ABC transporter substrate-binding protein [bacterium]
MNHKLAKLFIFGLVIAGLFLPWITFAKTPILKIGHVGHDHHTALYVAALNGDLFKKDYGLYLKEIKAKLLYEMYDGEDLVCELELFKVGGGSKMTTAMAQGTFDVGFGGVAAVAFFVDKSTPMKIISPLHSKGDMLVVDIDEKPDNWEEFVKYVKNREEPLKVGFKAPKAVALLIFQAALDHEGIAYSSDVSKMGVNVHLINIKEASQLNPGLQNDIIDAYVCNNPVCAIAVEKGIGRAIADLNDLPPGMWKDHPCCMIAAMNDIMQEKRALVVKFLELMIIATDYINTQPMIGYQSASEFIGTSLEVEKMSMPTSLYTTDPYDEVWLNGIYTWVHAMEKLDHIKGELVGKSNEEIDRLLLDFSAIKEAQANVVERKKR